MQNISRIFRVSQDKENRELYNGQKSPHSHLIMKTLLSLKSKALFQEMIPRIIPTPKKSEDVVKTCVSLKKHTGKKDGRNFTKT